MIVDQMSKENNSRQDYSRRILILVKGCRSNESQSPRSIRGLLPPALVWIPEEASAERPVHRSGDYYVQVSMMQPRGSRARCLAEDFTRDCLLYAASMTREQTSPWYCVSAARRSSYREYAEQNLSVVSNLLCSGRACGGLPAGWIPN